MTDKDKLSREDLRADRAAPPRRGTLHRILVLVAVLAVVLGAVLAAAYLDLSNFDSLRRALSYDKADAAGENTYDYDNDRTNRFALLGDRLLVVSTTRVSVLADDGSEVYAQEVKLDSPAIALGGRTAPGSCGGGPPGRTAAVYDVGGTTLYILGERGLVRDLSTETENGIISAKLNSSDMLALVTDKSGYKSSVSVYNASGERVFTFNSSNRYMIDACVERGGKHVAVATLGSEDAMFVSTIRRYALDQETAVSACVLDDSLLYELSSFGGTLVAVTDDRFLALSGDGSLGGSYDYAYPYLRGSTLGGTDFGALVLSRYRSGSAGKLVTVGAEGNLIASLDTQRDVLDISAAGKYLAVLYSDELVIYTSDLAEYASLTDTQYARGVRMRADGSAVLLGSQHGWLFVP